jgi:protein-S-isoprenylcysteine O-methyltransferase Ste14
VSLQTYAYVILGIGWLLWAVPFIPAFFGRSEQKAETVDRRARIGMILEALGYVLLWQGKFWLTAVTPLRLVLSIVFLAFANLLSWTAPRVLGKQWRFDAGLSPDHTLVCNGPYRFLRHPIYTSMFCILLGMGFMVTPLWLFLPAISLFLIGTEIRVRLEDRLLAARFGEEFASYRARVSAYIPFVK